MYAIKERESSLPQVDEVLNCPPPSVQTNYESPYRKEMSIFRNELKHFILNYKYIVLK